MLDRRVGRTRARTALAAISLPAISLLAISLLALAVLVVSGPHTYWTQTDATVYRDAGRSLWSHPGQLYRRDFGVAKLPFTYTPFAAFAFAVVAALPFAVWQIGLAVLGVAALLSSARSALIIGRVPNPSRKALVLTAVCLWLEPVDMTFVFGQINLVLMALVLADFALPAASRWKGVGIGVAAGVKLTPLIFLAFLMLTGRWRAARTSMASVLATVLIGAILLPASSWRYWTKTVSRAGDDPSRLVNQSLNGLVRRAVHHAGAEHVLWLLAEVLVLATGLLIARAAARQSRELTGVCAAAATGLLVSPVSWTHHYVYVVAILALAFSAELGVWRRRALAVVTLACFGWWPLPTGPNGLVPGAAVHPSGLLRLVAHNAGRELQWDAAQFVFGNGYVWAALAFLALAAVSTSAPKTEL